MICRIWHGWTTPDRADAFEAMQRTEVLPGIHRIKGYQGAYLLKRPVGAEVEFTIVTLFNDMDAVRGFAGADYETAVIHEAAAGLLTRYDARSTHHTALVTPEQCR